MRLRFLLCLAAALATSCGPFPRDPEGTLNRVRSEGRFRVGIVGPANEHGLDAKAAQLVQRLSSSAGARAILQHGETEPLLDRLAAGELDLVVGRFEKNSPWTRLVTFGPPLLVEQQGKTTFHLTAAMRNGENAWIALIEREARNLAPEAQ
jgi:ABC-type phosphate/phosphonate transport system substrate-binding protein